MGPEVVAAFASRFLARHAGDSLWARFWSWRRRRRLRSIYEEETERLFEAVGQLGFGDGSTELRELRALVATETSVERFVAAMTSDELDALAREVAAEIEPALRQFQFDVLRRSFETFPSGQREVGAALVALLRRRAEATPLPLRRVLGSERADRPRDDDEHVLDLLSARRPVIGLLGREADLGELREWAENDEWISARLVTGAGGVGKTRLALALAVELAREKWAAGFLTHDELERALDEGGSTVESWSRPTLIVVDYASAAHESVHGLLRPGDADPGAEDQPADERARADAGAALGPAGRGGVVGADRWESCERRGPGAVDRRPRAVVARWRR